METTAFLPGIEGPAAVPGDGLLFVARGLELLVAGPADARRLPTVTEAGALADGLHFLGQLEGRPCYAATAVEKVEPLSGFSWVPARSLFGAVSDAAFGVVGRAIAIAEWDVTHRFCGRCATPTELVNTERARRCPKCQLPFYPRIPPAVIVLIEREGEALLARGVQFAPGRYSTVAGFVEPGESLEEAVRREVLEEVGVRLGLIRYFGSQPWPFGRSLMVGFNAQYAGGEIRIDPREIADARWFRPDAMPDMPPKMSIAHELITDWLRRMRGSH